MERRSFFCALAVLALGGCAVERAWNARWTAPVRYETVRRPLSIRSDVPLAAHERMIDDLVNRRNDLCRHLALPEPKDPIEVFLFADAESLEGFMRLHHGSLPLRRAYFIEADSQIAVYARWGDRIGEDLRHELTHAYLHELAPELPLWLDEGLAEYYETPRGTQGANAEHLEWFGRRLEAKRWRPNLDQLELIAPDAEMTGADYAEAWAWVHFLLHSGPENREILRGYLAEIHEHRRGGPLAPRLRQTVGDINTAMLGHLTDLLQGHRPTEAGSP